MDCYEPEIALIKKVLQENPKGMTVSDISRKIKVNRNSVAKYLDIMRISGHVEMITFGPAKVFFPTRRIPISNMLNYTSDYIMVFDNSLKITLINDSFLEFMKINRENIIGQTVHEIILRMFSDESELFLGIKEALDGRDYTKELDYENKKQRFFFIVKIKPTTFEDGKNGGTIIIKNKTGAMLAEKALRDSEENFRKLLKKISKK
jgi:PAS domain S-box-containing protein